MLLLFGGLVTNTGAALAVPDWPTTFGYNMFLYPWSKMVGGVFYEHSHRLLGAFVGVLTLAVAAALWITERRRGLRWFGLILVLLVGIQGLLGGLRVLLMKQTLAVLHGSLAPAFFALTVGLALVTSPVWAEEPGESRRAPDLTLKGLALLTTGVLYLQIVFGALLTHLGQRLDGHLAGALALVGLISVLAVRTLRRDASQPGLTRPARWLLGLLGLQLALGVGAYASRFTGLELPLAGYSSLAIPVIHRLIGAVLLALSVVFTVRVFGLAGAQVGSPSGRAILAAQEAA